MRKWRKPCETAKGASHVCFWQFGNLCTRFPGVESTSLDSDDFSSRIPVFKRQDEVTVEECRASFIPPLDREFDRNVVHMRLKKIKTDASSGSIRGR